MPLYNNSAPTTTPTNANILDTLSLVATPIYEDGVAVALPVPVPVPVAVPVEFELTATKVKFAHVNLVVLLA